MDKERIIYQICVDDIITVINENKDLIDIQLNDDDISFITDKVGNYIDWSYAIEQSLNDLQNIKKELNEKSRKRKNKSCY